MDPISLIAEYPQAVSVILGVTAACTLVAVLVPEGSKADQAAHRVAWLGIAVDLAREAGTNLWGIARVLKRKK